jgi:hypothetical protein
MISMHSPTHIKSTISLHPNPVTDYLHINGLTDTALLIISDLNCIPFLRKQIGIDERIALDKLKKGVYIAKIITSSETIERKLVKE